jgi:ABC-type multidrug transport system ATPase subunit
MHTAQHLVNNCLASELVRGRTVILVTHHINLSLPISSYLVELSHGSVIRNGPIQDFHENVLQKVREIEDKPFVSEDREDLPIPDVNEADVLQSGSQTPRQSPLKPKDGKLIEVEARAEGRVSLKTYLTYIKAAGISSWILTFMLMLAIRAINIGNQVSLVFLSFQLTF